MQQEDAFLESEEKKKNFPITVIGDKDHKKVQSRVVKNLLRRRKGVQESRSK